MQQNINLKITDEELWMQYKSTRSVDVRNTLVEKYSYLTKYIAMKTTGGYQSTFQEVARMINTIDGQPVTQVYAVTLDKLKNYAGRTDSGSYQDWCREVLRANDIDW